MLGWKESPRQKKAPFGDADRISGSGSGSGISVAAMPRQIVARMNLAMVLFSMASKIII
jgi:hypothetical protein